MQLTLARVAILVVILGEARGCADSGSYCSYWKELGYCEETSLYYDYMRKDCAETCGKCPVAPPSLAPTTVDKFPGCTDKSSYCSSYKNYCQSSEYTDYLKKNCRRSCNFCHITTEPISTTVAPTTDLYTVPGGSASLQPGCGKKAPGHMRIVGGKAAKPGDWPWIVTFDYKQNFGNPGHHCGGSLLTSQWILSAAHCFFDDKDESQYSLKLGEHDLGRASGYEQNIPIAEIIFHPSYDPSTYNNDLVLIKLARKATINDRVRTVCLPDQNSTFDVGQKCVIAGWGLLKAYGRGPKVSGKITTLMLALYVLIPVLFSMKQFKRTNSLEMIAATALEIFTNVYFTIEFILRIWSCPDKRNFIASKMNWIDFLSLWSFYLEIAVSDKIARRYIGLLAVFRIVKIFRTFRYNYALQVLANTLKESLPELLLLVFLLTILALGFAFCNYHLEDDSNNFYNIPNSLWWSLITMTTVGYGDMVPKKWAGKIIGIACAICGLLMVALPVSVVATNFSVYYSYAKARIKLPPKKKVKPGMFSNALNMVNTEEPVKGDKLNRVVPINGVQVPAHHVNGTLPPVEMGPRCQEMKNRWFEAVEKMKQHGFIKKKLDIAQLVSVFGSKGAWK